MTPIRKGWSMLARRALGVVAIVTLLGAACAQSADLEIQMWSDNGGYARAGEQVEYTIIVTNWGPDEALNVEIRDQLTTSAYEAFDANGCSIAVRSEGGAITSFVCNFALSSGIYELGRFGANSLVPIAPIYNPSDPSEPLDGNQAQVIITIEGVAQEAMSLTNLVTVTSDTPDPDTSNNTATDFVAIEAVSDLQLALAGGAPTEVVAGERFDLRFDVLNDGPSSSLTTGFEALLPPGTYDPSVSMRYDDGSAVQGDCSIEAVASGGWLVRCGLGIVFAVDDPQDIYGTDPLFTPYDDRVRWIDVSAGVAADRIDPVPVSAAVETISIDKATENDRVATSFDVTVQSALDLSLSGPSTIAAGGTGGFTMTIANEGPSLARGVLASLSVPAGLEVIGATVLDDVPTPCAVTSENGPSDTATCALRDLTSLGLDEPVVKVEVAASSEVAAGANLNVQARVEANGGSAFATAATTTVAQPGEAGGSSSVDLSLSGPSELAPGGAGGYTMTVDNDGSSLATGVVASLTVPDGMRVLGATVIDAAPSPCAITSESAPSDTATCALRDVAPAVDERVIKVEVGMSEDVATGERLTLRGRVEANGGSDSATAATTTVAQPGAAGAEPARLLASAGPATPISPVEVASGAQDVPVLQTSFEVPEDSPSVELDGLRLLVNSSVVTASGVSPSAMDFSDVASVQVHVDGDGDGEVDAGSAPVASATELDALTGEIALGSSGGLVLEPGTATLLLVVIDVAGSAAAPASAALLLGALPFALLASSRRRWWLVALVALGVWASAGCSQTSEEPTTTVTLETRLVSVEAHAAGTDAAVDVEGLPLQGGTVVVQRTP